MEPASAPPLSVNLDNEINATPQHVWNVMTRPEVMREWASISQFTPEVGTSIHQYTDSQGEPVEPNAAVYHITGEVVTLDPPHTLAFTWRQVHGPSGAWPASTLVTLRLEPTATGTRVSVHHSGFEALGDTSVDLRDGHEAGWNYAFGILKDHAERH